MKSLELSADIKELDIRREKIENSRADCAIGFSLGALMVLRAADQFRERIILINPPLPKRSLASWLLNWVRYLLAEGLLTKRQKFTKNPIKLIICLINNVKLLRLDFSTILDSCLLEKIIVIRGLKDDFFCDDRAADFIRSKNIKLIEIDSGHNWSLVIEETLRKLI